MIYWLQFILRPIYHRAFRLKIKFCCWWKDYIRSTRGEGEDLPPAILRFKVAENISSDKFLLIGKACARIVVDNLKNYGITFNKDLRVLDFGCGCGRTLRWLMKDFSDVDFYGVDVDGQAIAWCSSHLKGVRVQVNESMPPLLYPPQFFDVIYCLSIFTHLNETMQDAWLKELYRILKPGGLILATVHGKNAVQQLSRNDLETLNSRGFLHKKSRKLRGIVPDWYHTTWHSRNYAISLFSNWFQDVSYTEIVDGLQDVVVGRKVDG